MRTLDEVITALEKIDATWRNDHPSLNYEDLRDALHYLKEYRKLDSLDAVAFPEDDNTALSWDELRKMEGKPVWVEYEQSIRNRWGHKCWHIIRNFQIATFDGKDHHWMRVDMDGVYFDSEDLGKTWQAYRKERE